MNPPYTDQELREAIAQQLVYAGNAKGNKRYHWHLSQARWLMGQLKLPVEKREPKPA